MQSIPDAGLGSVVTKSKDVSALTSLSSSESVGKIHCVLTIGRIGEAILSLSPNFRSKFFPDEIYARLKKMRDIIFHPEREENWEMIANLLYKGKVFEELNQEFFIEQLHQILRGYILAREVYDFRAERKWDLDEVDEINAIYENDNGKLYTEIQERIHPVLRFLWARNINIPTDLLWRVLSSEVQPQILEDFPDEKGS